MATNMKLRTAKKARTCNGLPRVWAAIAGCEGKTKQWRWDPYPTTSHVSPEFWCPTCAAWKARADALRGDAHQAFLTDEQERAGVINYRYARVKRGRDGRLTILTDGSREQNAPRPR